MTRDPGAVHRAPECGTRGAQDGVSLADSSLNHGSEWIEPALAADDAVDQFVCHLRHLLWWNRVEGGGSPMTHRSTQPARHIKSNNLMSFDVGPAVTDQRERTEDPSRVPVPALVPKERRPVNPWPRP